MKVLIVEDNVRAREGLERNLRQFFPDKNFIFFSTGTAAQALQFARTRGPFRLGLVDLELEDSKPDETAEIVPQLNCDAVIAMSGVASGDARKHVRRCGAVDYLEKPIISEVLVDKVARVLGKTDGDKGEYAEIQHKAQRRLQERIVAPSTPVMSHASSRMIKVGIPLISVASAVFLYTVGWARGAWSEQEKKGADKQALVDQLDRIETGLKTVTANQGRDDRNILKLCFKVGVEPDRN